MSDKDVLNQEVTSPLADDNEALMVDDAQAVLSDQNIEKSVQEAVEKAVENATEQAGKGTSDESAQADLKEVVKAFTLQALTQAQLDKVRIKEVISQVMEGALKGLPEEVEVHQALLKSVVEGVEEALVVSAQAAYFSLEEAKEALENYKEEVLDEELCALATLQEILQEVLKELASETKQTSAQVLQRLLEHAQASGTVAAALLRAQAKEAKSKLKSRLKEDLKHGKRTAQTVGGLFAQAAAGVLEGMAEAVKERGKR